MKKLLILLSFLLVVTPAFGATYTVKTSGGDYSTISGCTNDAPGSMGADHICEVYNGSFSGWTQSDSGTNGYWIIARNATGQTPSISSRVTFGGSDYIEVTGFTANGGFGASSTPTYLKMIDNIIDGTGSDLISMRADYVLISGNTFQDLQSEDAIRQFGDYWIIRNNVMENEDDSEDQHMDFWQSWCAGGVAASYFLIENNRFLHITGGNSHYSLINDTTQCDDPTTNSIIRYNVLYDLPSMACYIDDNNAEPGGGPNVIYSNTFVYLHGNSPLSWMKFAHPYAASDNSSGINNIFVDAMHHQSAEGFEWGSNGAQSYNLYDDTDYTMTFGGLASSETGAVKNQDPLFTAPGSDDFTLQSSSPARNTGGPLTAVASGDSGSGTTLVVDEAEFFQDGWTIDGVDADYIAVGTVGNTVQISSINYGTDTITLVSGISRSDSDPIWLYKDSDGTIVLYGSAPDIGAKEYVEGNGNGGGSSGGAGILQ